ncbi:MAG: DUF2975 domain-containing protein [Alphaproteobacteria bacterium]|nr:MAG: DUF2975 domain-containing protein [Alphaproteobacteria bacterium]
MVIRMNHQPPLYKLTTATAWVCIAGIVAIPVGLGALWANIELFSDVLHTQFRIPQGSQPFPLETRVLGWLCSMLPGALMMWGLYHLRYMLLECRAGRYFSIPSVTHFRRFAWALLLYAAAMPVRSALTSVVLTWHNPPGERALALSFSSNELSALFTAVLFVIIAHILEEGRKIADENAGFL